jgi:hypothetical protein
MKLLDETGMLFGEYQDENMAKTFNICAIISFQGFQNSGSVVTLAAFQHTCGQPLQRTLE